MHEQSCVARLPGYCVQKVLPVRALLWDARLLVLVLGVAIGPSIASWRCLSGGQGLRSFGDLGTGGRYALVKTVVLLPRADYRLRQFRPDQCQRCQSPTRAVESCTMRAFNVGSQQGWHLRQRVPVQMTTDELSTDSKGHGSRASTFQTA